MTKYDSGHEAPQAGPILPASLDWLSERAAEAASAAPDEYGLTAFSRDQMRELNDVLRGASAAGDHATIAAVREAMAQAYMPCAGHFSRLVATYLGLDAATEQMLQEHGVRVVRAAVIGWRHQGDAEVVVASPRSRIIGEVEERLWVDALRAFSQAHVTWRDAPEVLRLLDFQESFMQATGREPTMAEFAGGLNCEPWRAEELWNLARPWAVPASLLEPLGNGDDDEQSPDDVTSELEVALAVVPSAEDAAMHGIVLRELMQVISRGGLTARELWVLVLRSGMLPRGELEFEELARMLGVSKSRAYQIAEMASRKAAWAISRDPDI